MYRPICICSIAPRFQLKTRVTVLMHFRELKLPTNTAQLAKLTLENFDLRVRGLKDEPMNDEGLVSDAFHTLLLYPSEQSVELSAELLAPLTQPVHLVVPDGNWRQASKMAQRIPSLKSVTQVRVPLGNKSEYRLRHEHREDGLCTFEAIARALGVIEGREVQEKLEEVFKIRIERTLWSRGVLPPEECLGGVPEEAFLQSYLAGAAGGAKPRHLR